VLIQHPNASYKVSMSAQQQQQQQQQQYLNLYAEIHFTSVLAQPAVGL
jgi:hypothetical protein